MALTTRGTNLYFVNPADDSVVKVGCPTSISGITAAREQVEITCLEDTTRRYESGLATPGAAQFTLYFDPTDPSHILLHELYAAGTTIKWALAYSDGTADPTVDTAGDFVLPTSRSFVVFQGYVSDFSFDFQLNASVNSTLSVQVSGFPNLVEKTA